MAGNNSIHKKVDEENNFKENLPSPRYSSFLEKNITDGGGSVFCEKCGEYVPVDMINRHRDNFHSKKYNKDNELKWYSGDEVDEDAFDSFRISEVQTDEKSSKDSKGCGKEGS